MVLLIIFTLRKARHLVISAYILFDQSVTAVNKFVNVLGARGLASTS